MCSVSLSMAGLIGSALSMFELQYKPSSPFSAVCDTVVLSADIIVAEELHSAATTEE